jgi:subtilisin family serine protease
VPTAPAAPSGVATQGLRHFHGRAALHDFDSQIVVTLAHGVDPASVASAYGASVLEWVQGERIAVLAPDPNHSAAALQSALGGDSRVTTIEQNVSLETAEARQKSFAFDDGFGSLINATAQPALEALHVDVAHNLSTGTNVRVAILDTGIDPEHPLLKYRIQASWDFIDGHAGATDIPEVIDSNGDGTLDGAWGHGTHIAGIVALTAPGARLLVGRVLDSDGQGDVLTVAAGIRWAVENHAQIINLSLGCLEYSEAIAAALEEARAAGAIVICSGGNWGAEYPQEYPATSSIVCEAVAACDVFATPASWTSYGNYIGLAAPGIAIRSAFPGGTYRLWSGTSMSAPFVAGTAAMLLANHPNWTPADLRERLSSTATPLIGLNGAQVGKLGSGMLNAGAALLADGGDDPMVEDFLHH